MGMPAAHSQAAPHIDKRSANTSVVIARQVTTDPTSSLRLVVPGSYLPQGKD
jgi:hypothetical protein